MAAGHNDHDDHGHDHPHEPAQAGVRAPGHDHPHPGEAGTEAAGAHKHGRLGSGHTHDHGQAGQILAEGSAEGIRALRISAIGLAATAAFQLVVVAFSGSVALLADGLHNVGDVATTIALWIAFVATRKAADHRYTFGYQRFEDLAGLFIIAAVFASAALAMYEGVTHLIDRRELSHLNLAMAAGVVGFVGNEVVAQYKIRAGRRIDSPALVAEGQHSRVDGLASLAAVAGIAGVALGLPWTDPVAGIAIALVIGWIGYTSGKPIVARLVDRVDPAIIERIAREAASVEDVCDVHAIRARHAGRALYVLMHVALPADMSLEDAHSVGEEVRHKVLHALPQVVQVDLHIDPFGKELSAYHEATAHHFEGH